MLQQTQVATVIPYFRRFLKAFPNVESLARAPIETVLALWSGLGYYRRARHLHRAAQMIANEFQGLFPSDYKLARSLPGVGDYTARAVLSIAYGLPLAVMDGNVMRVIARLGTIAGGPAHTTFRRRVERELARLISRRRPGAFNQALMELGQTLCLPRAPRCEECPLGQWCRARHAGRPESFPEPKPRRAPEAGHLAAAIVTRRRQIALVRGLDNGLLPDMWNFPSAFGRTRAEAARNLSRKLQDFVPGPVVLKKLRGELRHAITFRSICIHLFAAELSNGRGAFHWLDWSRLDRAAISQLTRKIAARARQMNVYNAAPGG